MFGGGQSIANVPRMNATLATVPPELAGAASATDNASIQLGSALGIAIMGALFQNIAPKTYLTDLAARGLTGEQIDKSVEVLNAWLDINAGDVASQFGITVQQLEGVISYYQHASTSGVGQVLWVGAAVLAIGAVLAWLTFKQKEEK